MLVTRLSALPREAQVAAAYLDGVDLRLPPLIRRHVPFREDPLVGAVGSALVHELLTLCGGIVDDEDAAGGGSGVGRGRGTVVSTNDHITYKGR